MRPTCGGNWPRCSLPRPNDTGTCRKESGMKYRCTLCSYVYDPAVGDPENGVQPGTAFADLPAEWVCPECGAGKEDFEPVEEE